MLKSIALSLCLLYSLPSFAQAPNVQLSKCLADSTTGKDRKNLARWIFSAMTVHPEIRDLASTTPDVTDQTSRTMGSIVTRLLTDNCVTEAKSVVQADGPSALGKAFETLGQLAMMELISNADVAASVSRFERYVDQEKMKAVLEIK